MRSVGLSSLALPLLSSVLAAVVGCSASAEPSGPSADPGAGSPAPGAPQPVACAEGTYRTAENACEAFPTVSVKRAGVVIGPVRDHHATMVREIGGTPYLYVFGGTEDWKVLHDDVQRAPIGADGTLGAFEPAGKLPAPRAGQCIVKVEDRYLVAGGIVPTEGRMITSPSTLLVTIGADGKVAATEPGPALPTGVMHLTCDVSGGFVYALGGRNAKSRSTTMAARAKIGPGGTVGAFEPQSPLTPDRSHHASFVRGNRIYVLGGLTGDPTGEYEDHSDAIMADIAADGTLGAWTPAGNLPTTLGVTSAQLYKDAVYVVGGLEGVMFTDKIRRATFTPEGTLSEFVTLDSKLPSARGHVHQTPMWKNFFFSVGGQDNDGASLGTVDVGAFQ